MYILIVDILDKNRLGDNRPDLGAYEYIPKKDDEE